VKTWIISRYYAIVDATLLAEATLNRRVQYHWGGFGLSRTRANYSINLSALHATCESNYFRLLQLFPDYETSNFREFVLSGGERVRIDVVERCRYTTCLKVFQQGGLNGWLSSPRFEVRVYHDARMAEVVSFQSRQRTAARYEYPNPEMHARDEKAQQNLFLAEWLSHCQEQGCSEEGLSAALPGAVDAS
jgi:uncharacterized protein